MDTTVDTSALRQIKNNFLSKIFGKPEICHTQFELTPFLDKTIPLLHTFCMIESGFIISIIAKSYAKAVNDLDDLVQNMIQNVDDPEKPQHPAQQQSVLTKKRKMSKAKAKQTTVQFSTLEPKNLICSPKSKLMETYKNTNVNVSNANISTNNYYCENDPVELNDSKHSKDDGKQTKRQINKFKRSFYISILQKNYLSHSTDDNESIVDDRGNSDNRQKYCLFTNYVDEHNFSLRNENGYYNNVINTINKTRNNNNNNNNNNININSNVEDKINMYRAKPFHVYSYQDDIEKTIKLKLHSSEYLNRVKSDKTIEKIVLLSNEELRNYNNGKAIDYMLHVLNNNNISDIDDDDLMERDSGNESISDVNELNNIDGDTNNNNNKETADTFNNESINLQSNNNVNVNVCDYEMDYDDEKYRIPTNTGVTGTTIKLSNNVNFFIPPLEKNILINNFPFMDEKKLLYTSSLKVCDWMALLPNIELVPEPPDYGLLINDILGLKAACKRKHIFQLTPKMLKEFRLVKRAKMDETEDFKGFPTVGPFEFYCDKSQSSDCCSKFYNDCIRYFDAQILINENKKAAESPNVVIVPNTVDSDQSMTNLTQCTNETSTTEISTQNLTVDSTMESTQNGIVDNSMGNVVDQSTTTVNSTMDTTNNNNNTQMDVSNVDETINGSQLVSSVSSTVESNSNGGNNNNNNNNIGDVDDDEYAQFGHFSIEDARRLPIGLLVTYLQVNPIPIDIRKLQVFVYKALKAFAPACLSLAQLQNKHVQYTVSLTFFAVLHLANKKVVAIINLSTGDTLAEAKDIYVELLHNDLDENADVFNADESQMN